MQLVQPKILLVALLAACHPDPGSSHAARPFVDLPFEQALERAREQDKVVMVDFFATWCPPCKQLDKTTWKDADVIAWLEQETVALKIDAEKEAQLARRFRLEGYPTMLFVDPDGSEIDRILGYRDAAAFLGEAQDMLER